MGEGEGAKRRQRRPHTVKSAMKQQVLEECGLPNPSAPRDVSPFAVNTSPWSSQCELRPATVSSCTPAMRHAAKGSNKLPGIRDSNLLAETGKTNDKLYGTGASSDGSANEHVDIHRP